MIPLPPPNPALPALGVLLDGDAMGEVLRSCLPDLVSGGLRLEACRPNYVRYKPGTGCLVGYALSLRGPDGAPVETLAHARMYADGRAEALWESPSFGRLVERAARRHPHPPLGRAAYAPSLGALVQLYPVDEELPALVRASSPRKMRRLLSEALPAWGASPPDGCEVTLVRYKPARKALLRYRPEGAAGGTVYGKLQTHDKGAELLETERSLRAAGVRMPSPLAYLPELRMLVHEEALGTRLADLRGTAEFGEWTGGVAEALARLHAATVPRLPPHSARDEAATVLAVAGAVGALLPELAGEAGRLGEEVARGLEETASLPPVTVHGDFYDDQLLVSDAGVTMLDFEEARLGDPRLDVGNFLAHQGRWEDDHGAGGAREAFLEACATLRPEVRERAELFEAAALLKLAVGPFRRLEPEWPESMERLVRLAGERLREGGRSGVDRSTHPTWRGQTGMSAPPAGSWAGRVSASLAAMLPSDPALPQLPSLLDPVQMGEELTRVYSEPVEVAAVQVVRHKPGRRCILCYDLRIGSPGGDRCERLYAKTFASERGPRVFEIARAIAGARACGPGVQLPEPVGYLPELKLLLQREVRGEPLSRLLLGGYERAAAGAAEAVRALHASGLDLGRRHDLDKELAPLQARVERLCAACPRLSGLARECLGLVGERSERDFRWRYLPIHRDFYHDQLLMGERGLAVLDLDDAAMSEPAVDVANFLAHLRLLSLEARGVPDALSNAGEAFEGRYGSLDMGTDLALVRFLEGATLLRLAEIHLPHERGEWLAGRLLEESGRLLRAAARGAETASPTAADSSP